MNTEIEPLTFPCFKGASVPAGAGSRATAGTLQPAFACSRSKNFWILPVEVFGNGPNTTVRGIL